MHVENKLYPPRWIIQDLENDTSSTPIVMLNLLKFRDRAEYGDGRQTSLTGREAYMIYFQAMEKIVAHEGGRFLFKGDILSGVIGLIEQQWDAAALVEYPSSAEFVRITSLPSVTDISQHRTAGLAGQILIRVAPT